MKHVWLSLVIMALTIYGIRLAPFLFLRKPIHNRWLRSFLTYVPYVTLSVMTFPAILSVTDDPLEGLIAFISGVVAAFISGDLFVVAITACAAVFISGLIL